MAGSVVILYDSVSPSTSVPVNLIVSSTSSSALIICAVGTPTSFRPEILTVTILSALLLFPTTILKPKLP